MERYSTLLVREMQSEAAMNQTTYHYTPSGMATIKNTDNTKCQRNCGETGAGTVYIAGKNATFQPLWKTVGSFL